ncbi:MAG: hypothetical protein LUO80_01215 [Methylococcaceae bacterium]|nr:hypothetical protein [Methylococcaceae bacterium]
MKGNGSMGAMMEQMPAGHMMANMPRHTGMAAMGTAAVAATTHTGRSFLGVLSRHPLVIFGLGVAAGYYAHKYRKEIIRSATSITDKGKDFVQPQRKNLEDLVSECKECADDESSEGKTQGKKT